METLVIVCIWLGIALYKVSVRSRGVPRQVKTACLTCVNSLVTKTDRGEVLVNCFYGGTVRLVKVAVCECSGYAARGAGAKLVTIEGFVRDEPVVYEEVAMGNSG